jgi:hypothetical protein
MSDKRLRVFLEERRRRHAGHPFDHPVQCREACPDDENRAVREVAHSRLVRQVSALHQALLVIMPGGFRLKKPQCWASCGRLSPNPSFSAADKGLIVRMIVSVRLKAKGRQKVCAAPLHRARAPSRARRSSVRLQKG